MFRILEPRHLFAVMDNNELVVTHFNPNHMIAVGAEPGIWIQVLQLRDSRVIIVTATPQDGFRTLPSPLMKDAVAFAVARMVTEINADGHGFTVSISFDPAGHGKIL